MLRPRQPRRGRRPTHGRPAPHPPRAPAGRRHRRPRHRRRHHRDGRRLAERAPGRPALPAQAGHRERPDRVQVDEDAKGKTLLDNASGRLDEVDQLSRAQPRRRRGPQHPPDLHRPGQRGLRPADVRLRGARARGVDRGAPRVHLRQHDDAHRPRGRWSRGRPRRADQGRAGADPSTGSTDRLPDLRRRPVTEFPPAAAGQRRRALDQSAEALAGGERPARSRRPTPPPVPASSSPTAATDGRPSALNPPQNPGLHPAGHGRHRRATRTADDLLPDDTTTDSGSPAATGGRTKPKPDRWSRPVERASSTVPSTAAQGVRTACSAK